MLDDVSFDICTCIVYLNIKSLTLPAKGHKSLSMIVCEEWFLNQWSCSSAPTRSTSFVIGRSKVLVRSSCL